MKKKVAVEGSLRNVKQYLQEQGYDVADLKSNNLSGYDAIIISGQDDNMMGIYDTQTKAPVIDASGKSATEVYDQLKGILR